MRRIAAILFCLILLTQLRALAQSQILIIAYPGVKIDQISRNDLRDVFTGASITLRDGSRAVPVLLKDGVAHEVFLQEFIGKSNIAYRAGWRGLIFIGHASMPRSLEPESAVVDFVARTPGSIAYISRETPHPGVKVLPVR